MKMCGHPASGYENSAGQRKNINGVAVVTLGDSGWFLKFFLQLLMSPSVHPFFCNAAVANPRGNRVQWLIECIITYVYGMVRFDVL